ncbi:efflux RND transporter periplasmic adaptor subunit [Gracilinema caldarium]|uniref:Efflux transporter, RND family, MFP subunit n=1 Tax=Gracilinema caldarium (strain ATCC 51460 / DSM 7334 / H1) TaxID=744872 RepID=F8EZC8_GRAC1|nr:efflux RND transporter periplasmic adaptor subunit [Gracilinema caldarium]AEJ20151.1 efflux transporter, RND family, MFP subunit [Gracilinema caldarium DSM 7334]
MTTINHYKAIVFIILRWAVPFLILIGAFVVSQQLGKMSRIAQHQNPIPVRVMQPEFGDLVRTLTINGYVESETIVTVLPLVSGVLQELTVDVGDRVKRDQIIARIDPERFLLQLKQAETAYLSTKSTYERISQLYKADATSTLNFEQAKAQYETYQSQYELAKLQLEYTRIKSPMDGVVLQRHLSVGSLAVPERPLLTIADLNNLLIRCQIPEHYYTLFLESWQDGSSKLRISIRRSDGLILSGKLRSVSPYIKIETKNFEAVISVASGVEDLRPGMFVTNTFELSRIRDVYTLPFSALAGGNRLWYVEDGRAKRSEITITESNDAFFVVTPEWKERDVIVEGWYFLREGSPVVVNP